MTTPTKLLLLAGVAILLLAVIIVIVRSPNTPTAQVAFSCLGVSTSSNTRLISIGITNRSASTIAYFVGPPQVKSNGVWSAFQIPLGTTLSQLAAAQSGTAIVTTPLVSG